MKILSHTITAMLMILMSSALVAQQSSEGMTMDGGMMSGWFMLLCVGLAVLLFVALVLAIMALFKYLFGRKP